MVIIDDVLASNTSYMRSYNRENFEHTSALAPHITAYTKCIFTSTLNVNVSLGEPLKSLSMKFWDRWGKKRNQLERLRDDGKLTAWFLHETLLRVRHSSTIRTQSVHNPYTDLHLFFINHNDRMHRYTIIHFDLEGHISHGYRHNNWSMETFNHEQMLPVCLELYENIEFSLSMWHTFEIEK